MQSAIIGRLIICMYSDTFPLPKAIKTVLVILFFALFSILVPTFAQAQGQAGVSISPAIVEETVDPGMQQKYSVTIKNLNDYEQKFYLFTRNISDVRDGGTPVFTESTGEKTGMELAEWVTLPVSEITLSPGVDQQIDFTLSVPTDAIPGSHFGGIVISVDPPDITSSGAAVGYQVANIISIRVSGDAQDSANIRQFSTKKFFHGSKNVDFLLRIENTGSTLVRPSGPVEITNMLGKSVGTFTFNESQNGVFPKKLREYAFNWQGEGTGFGRYEAVISPVYGDEGAKKTMSSTVSFWILPMNIILPALGALVFVLLITYFFVRLYIRRTLAHLSGQTRIVRRRRNKGVSASLLLVVVMLTVTAIFMIIMLAVFA
jgi:Bacterial protein of unknown function (DUF916)